MVHMIKIVAFLQNPYFRPGNDPRLIEKYRMDPEFHRRVLLMSATGRALYAAFGPKLYHEIIWDNANPKHGHTRNAMLPADVSHMEITIMLHDPDLILCFGKQAQMGMSKLMGKPSWPNVLFAPHPMARGSAADHLRDIVKKVRKLI